MQAHKATVTHTFQYKHGRNYLGFRMEVYKRHHII